MVSASREIFRGKLSAPIYGQNYNCCVCFGEPFTHFDILYSQSFMKEAPNLKVECRPAEEYSSFFDKRQPLLMEHSRFSRQAYYYMKVTASQGTQVHLTKHQC